MKNKLMSYSVKGYTLMVEKDKNMFDKEIFFVYKIKDGNVLEKIKTDTFELASEIFYDIVLELKGEKDAG